MASISLGWVIPPFSHDGEIWKSAGAHASFLTTSIMLYENLNRYKLNIYSWVHVYEKYYLRVFLARRSSSAERFFSQFRPRAKLSCHRYFMKHVWISAELCGGARRIKRRLAGNTWLGIIPLPWDEQVTWNTPNSFQILMICINCYNYLFFVVFVCVIRLSLGKLLVNLLQVVKRTDTLLIP